MDETRHAIEELKKRDREELADLIKERAAYARAESEAAAGKKACTEQIIPILERLDIKSLDADDDQGMRRRILVVKGSNTVIDRKLLLSQGVDPAKIEASTKRTEFVTLQMRELKGTS